MVTLFGGFGFWTPPLDPVDLVDLYGGVINRVLSLLIYIYIYILYIICYIYIYIR